MGESGPLKVHSPTSVKIVFAQISMKLMQPFRNDDISVE